ncbi:uncharacterized protein LOC141879995 isoform X3 [Acropora palmata]|uniref:uncharacterized protein LOC141879995 isoform X3 n=1 Tax=Acropora palmata TaxID=6131 RepID=UPI003DA0AB42
MEEKNKNSQRHNAITAAEEAPFTAAPSYSLPSSLSNLSLGVLNNSQPERGNSPEICRLQRDDFEQQSANTSNLSETATHQNDQPQFFEAFDRRSLASPFPQHELEGSDNSPNCCICLFKRWIIGRNCLEYALYIFVNDKFNEVYPKVKRDEALVNHGTEFAFNEVQKFAVLHQQFEITDNVSVKFELVNGHYFSIISKTQRKVTLSDIRSKSRERTFCGYSVPILIKCRGTECHLYGDRVKTTLQSSNRTLEIYFPVSYYEASVSHWLQDSHKSVNCMPQEDREALRSCYVDLIEKIRDVTWLTRYLYQHKILDEYDLEEISSQSRRSDRNAAFLDILPRRGNILDFVLKVMQV